MKDHHFRTVRQFGSFFFFLSLYTLLSGQGFVWWKIIGKPTEKVRKLNRIFNDFSHTGNM